MSYFPLLYRFRGKERLLLWIPGDTDSVATDNDGNVLSFANVDTLRSYAEEMHWMIDNADPVLHDLDFIAG